MTISEKAVEAIDEEWLELILEAKRYGLTIDEVLAFLNQHKISN